MTQMLKVNELFSSVQGEGYWMGAPTTFIRLQGCTVGCNWCDTKHTWSADTVHRVEFVDTVQQPEDRPLCNWSEASPAEVCAAAVEEHGENQHVVITGGEPLEQSAGVAELCERLMATGRSVQIETSGCGPVDTIPPGVWVTLSPKVGMDKTTPLDLPLAAFDEIKVVIDAKEDSFDKYMPYAAELNFQHRWLQPVSMSVKAFHNCVRIARALHDEGHPHWRVGMQMHKFFDVR